MKIEIASTDSLSLHPFLQQLPEPDSDLMTSMAADICDRGVQEALVVDEKGRVMNGRIRLKVATQIELPELPIIRRPSAEAATIIVQSLLQRRHYSKSALAYLTFPFFESLLVEARARRARYLSSPKGADASNSAQNALIGGKTAEDVARRAGISRRLFLQAAEVHKLFKKHPRAREVIEPQILSGELCLGYAINGIAGWLATQEGKNSGQSGSDQLELFKKGINSLRVRFSRWAQLSKKDQLFVANEFADAITEAPEEVQARVLSALRNRKAAAQ